MARPKITINWKFVAKKLQKGCDGASIASALGIHPNTLYERCSEDNKLSFSDFSAQKKGEGNDQLNTKQFDVAMKGNVSMLIWLGKQRLNQTDKHDIGNKDGEPFKTQNTFILDFGNDSTSGTNKD